MNKANKKLNKAIRENNYDLVRSLINDRILNINLNNLDGDENTYLNNAIKYSSVKIVRLLIKQGADVNLIDCLENNCLTTAIENYYIRDRLKKIKLLLDRNINPEIIKYSLHLAASSYGNS